MNSSPPRSRHDSIELLKLYAEQDRRRARTDPVFFISRYLRTYDPRPEAYPHHLDFTLYPYQEEYVLDTVRAIKEGTDIFDEKSRDMGASWLSLAVRFWFWCFADSYQSLLGSRKQEYVDDGTLKSLFPKLDYFILHIKDPQLLPKGFDPKKHRTYMKLINPETGNTISGESSNRDFSRGGRFDDVLFDEIAFWPDARNAWTAAGDATRCRHAVTTPPNEPSYAKALRNSGKVRVRTWHWRLHPHKDAQWYEREKARRSEEEVLHEIDISWEYTGAGRPYPEVDAVPHRPLPVRSRLCRCTLQHRHRPGRRLASDGISRSVTALGSRLSRRMRTPTAPSSGITRSSACRSTQTLPTNGRTTKRTCR
jgi:hypothetical protein